MLASLMFFTLAAGAVLGIGQFLWFLRRSHHRGIAAEALKGTSDPNAGSGVSGNVYSEGALPELLGLGAVALLAMALLIFAYPGRF